jgi:hypothetical protein
MTAGFVIHCEPRIPWQGPFAQKMHEGLRRLGLDSEISDSRQRIDGVPILLGTSCWRSVEATGDYLLVDRCSFGDTNHFVSLVWNGHGRRGDHRVPDGADAMRWQRHGVLLKTWRHGSRRVLCGQTQSYCDRPLEEWYRSVDATHFRPHPVGANPTGLPEWRSFADCEFITLNSSVAVQGLIEGVRTEVHDAGGMAYGCECTDDSRLALMHWLAWTQWHHEEIREGKPIAHLFEV